MGGQLSVGPFEAPSQPLQDSHNDAEHSISDEDLHDALIDERTNLEAKTA